VVAARRRDDLILGISPLRRADALSYRHRAGMPLPPPGDGRDKEVPR
jgi:hypothetical protein